jgi:hypothetical protein
MINSVLTSSAAWICAWLRECQQVQLTQPQCKSAESLLIRWVKRLISAKPQKVTSLEQDVDAADAPAWQQQVVCV